jgi:hypothetical protein
MEQAANPSPDLDGVLGADAGRRLASVVPIQRASSSATSAATSPIRRAQGSTANNSAGYTLSLPPTNGSRYASLSVPNLGNRGNVDETFIAPVILGAPNVSITPGVLGPIERRDDNKLGSSSRQWDKPVPVPVTTNGASFSRSTITDTPDVGDVTYAVTVTGTAGLRSNTVQITVVVRSGGGGITGGGPAPPGATPGSIACFCSVVDLAHYCCVRVTPQSTGGDRRRLRRSEIRHRRQFVAATVAATQAHGPVLTRIGADKSRPVQTQNRLPRTLVAGSKSPSQGRDRGFESRTGHSV